jgi:hypothetical protein
MEKQIFGTAPFVLNKQLKNLINENRVLAGCA